MNCLSHMSHENFSGGPEESEEADDDDEDVLRFGFLP